MRPRTATITPIHTAEDVEASEALMISALVSDGEFIPVRWGVSIEDVECFEAEWRFCEQYQQLEGEAPSKALLLHQFPDFPFVRGVGCEFAARRLGQDAQSRRLRRIMRKANEALRTGGVDEAQAILSETQVGRVAGKPGASIWDTPADQEDIPRWPTPFGTLNRVTGGGIGPSELWYWAGLAGHGKTMVMCSVVAKLLTEGLDVTYLSLEVPERVVNRRTRRALATTSELALLDAKTAMDRPDRESIQQAVASIRERVDGTLRVYDSTHGHVSPATVKYHCANADIVVVDHVGLMYTSDGKRAVDDWRLYATISNSLLEEKNASGTTILAAAQLNRTAHGTSRRAPGLDSMGGAYQLVQDADGVVTMKRRGKRAMVMSARKVRDGDDNVTWHTEFDVKRARFGEITADKADELEQEYPMDEDL